MLVGDLRLLVSQNDGELTRLRERGKDTEDRLAELTRRVEQLRIELSVLQAQLADLKKSGDVWGNRLWTVVIAAVAAALGYYLKR